MNTHIYLLLFSVVFIISCSDHKKATLPEHSRTKIEVTPKTNSQIAEYVRHVFQDKNGHLWFGTNNFGVAHYNGDNLVYYSHDQGFGGSQITGITEDLEKNLWFATDQGVVKYDWLTTEKGDKLFTNYSDYDVFNGGHFWSIYSDSKGIIWAGTGKELFRFNGKNWNNFELPYSKNEKTVGFLTDIVTWAISEDKNGNIWFGTNGNGAFKYDGKSFIQYTKKDGLTDNSVDNILEDNDGNIWFGTRHGGISRYNGKTFTNYTKNDSIANNEVCALYQDTIGNIWFSSEGFGVYRYDGKSFTNYSTNQGLGVKAVQTILEDREGRFWVGGGGGLYRFDGESFLNVTKNGPWK